MKSLFASLARLPSAAPRMLVVCLGLLAAHQGNTQNLRVVAANAAGSDVYDVSFSGSGGSITILNTDANAHTGIRSLAFRPNDVTGAIDLIAADTPQGTLLLYPATGATAQIIWQPGTGVARPADGAGPVRPDGISVDGFGNLFVASSASGNSIVSTLWVFPRNPAGPLPGGFGLPLLVDNDFGTSLLEETLIVRGPGSLAPAGTLLALTSSPSRVLAYTPAAVQGVLAGGGEIDPSTLLGANRFPATITPGGMDIWPADGSLLVTTSNGNILRFASSGASLPAFATGLGNGKFKIRAALENSEPLAVVANNNGGEILKFDGPASLVSVITSGVQRPQGVTVTNAGTGSASACAEPEGCDFIGNVLKHKVAAGGASLQGFVLEEPCVVQADPRVDINGVCNGQPLPLASVCPGFGTGVIPGYLCGGSGASGSGFAVIDTRSNFLVPEGSIVTNEAFAESVLGDKPECTATGSEEVVLWAPSAGEGTIAEGSVMLDVTVGCYNPLLGMTRGFSQWAFGLVLDPDSTALSGSTPTAKVITFVAGKYDKLLQTLSASSIQSKLKSNLVNCVKESRRQFDRKKYPEALVALQSCDALARGNPAGFSATSNNPNPFGEIVARFTNIDYTISYRLLP